MKLFSLQSYTAKTGGSTLTLKTKLAVGAAFTVLAKITVITVITVQAFIRQFAVINVITIGAVFVVGGDAHIPARFQIARTETQITVPRAI